MKKNKEKSEVLFENFYREEYGERWATLKEALSKDKDTMMEIPDLLTPYYLDTVSYRTADLLPIEPGMNVLDMCAAPGGKTLVLAKKLKGNGMLISNDRSPERRERLRKTISQSLTEEERSIIKITGFDASAWGVYEENIYDAILLDAPCSSERHVINDRKHLDMWSESRPKRLAILQYSMLSSALIAAKNDSYILYSTCSINKKENEMVIEKLFKRHEDEVSEIKIDYGENQKYGTIVLPDRSGGEGPMYACLLRVHKHN